MTFKKYYQTLSASDRLKFAAAAKTTVGYCNLIAHGKKQIGLGAADVFVNASGGALTLDSLPLSPRALLQKEARQPATKAMPSDIGSASASS